MNSTLNHRNIDKIKSEKIIKIRKQKIKIDGQSRVVVIIHDFSDSVKFQKVLLKLKEEQAQTNFLKNKL
jgi:hypothetical protein